MENKKNPKHQNPIFILIILIIFSLGYSNNSKAWMATTAFWKAIGNLTLLAGGLGGTGSLDGTGTNSRFAAPNALTVDSSNNIYVADTNNHIIRKITPAGVVTTLAGLAGNSGSTDGTGSAARFNMPQGVGVDSSGNVYVGDSQNHTIRKITPAGVVTTFAGLAGTSGTTDATGAAARFNLPYGVTVDSSDNVYVANGGSHTIRKITSAAVVTTLAGLAGTSGSTDATGAAARFNTPIGVTVDSSGNVYVADYSNHAIRKITSAGVVTTLAGLAGSTGSTDATGAAARFYYPWGITVDSSGNVYVGDTTNQTIRKITSAGVVTTLAGLALTAGYTDATGNAARFYAPRGVAVDSSGNVYVGDYSNFSIRKVTSAGVVTTFAGRPYNTGTTDATGAAARFSNFPEGVAVDTSGNVYVTDTGNHTIRKITPAGVVTTLAGLAGTSGSTDATGAAARFNVPKGVAVDSTGNVYVADTSNCTIRKITSAGVVTTLAGLALTAGSTDATGSAARFSYPRGVTVDSSGNVYVADSSNNTIRKITSAGVVTTLAGLAGASGTTDATGSAARFASPSGVAVDSSGNVFVADTNNYTIRKVTSAGVVTTLAGLAGTSGNTDGTGAAARFNSPNDIAVDSSGNLYVSETGNIIRKVTSAGVVTTVVGVLGSSGVKLGPLPGSLGSTVAVCVNANNLFMTSESSVLQCPKP